MRVPRAALIASLAAAVPATAVIVLAPASAQKGPIRIGYLAPLSGGAAQVGQDAVNGFKMYLEEIGYQMAGPIQNVYIRRVERKNGELQNTVIHTYPAVSQFWKYEPERFLAQPVYSRDFPPCRHC